MGYEVDDEEIGRNLARLRGDMSQDRLAERLGDHGVKWSQSTVWSVEKGARPLRLREAYAVAKVLGASVNALLGTEVRPGELSLDAAAATRTIRWAMDLQRELYRAAERAEVWSRQVRDLPADLVESLPTMWQLSARNAGQDPADWLSRNWTMGQDIDRQLREQAEGDRG